MQTGVTYSKNSEGIEIIFYNLTEQVTKMSVFVGFQACANIQLMTWDYDPEFTTD